MVAKNKLTNAQMDSFIAFDITSDVQRIETVLATSIFRREEIEHPLRTAAITEVMICLNDLLQKAKDFGFPVTFSDDVAKTDRISNVTDLISATRNALCHIPSNTRYFDENTKLGMVTIYGTGGKAFINGVLINNDYADDVCFIFGKVKVYLYRNIFRALTVAKFNFIMLVGFSAFPYLVVLEIPELIPLSLLLISQL